MTEEEMKTKIKELEDTIKAKDTTITSLESQRSNQNAYITKLETKARTLETNLDNVKNAANNSKDFPPEVVEYFQKKRREDSFLVFLQIPCLLFVVYEVLLVMFHQILSK